MMFAPFWSENGYRLYLFWSESREFGNARPYLSFEFEMNKKERELADSKLPACRRLLFPLLHACNKGNRRRLHAGKFEMAFTKSFSWRSNLSNDNITSAYIRSEKHFLSEIGSRFGEPGITPPQWIPRNTSSSHPPKFKGGPRSLRAINHDTHVSRKDKETIDQHELSEFRPLKYSSLGATCFVN